MIEKRNQIAGKMGEHLQGQIAALVWVVTFVVAAGWQPAQYSISRLESLKKFPVLRSNSAEIRNGFDGNING